MFRPGPQLRAYRTTWGGPAGMGDPAPAIVVPPLEIGYASLDMGEVELL